MKFSLSAVRGITILSLTGSLFFVTISFSQETAEDNSIGWTTNFNLSDRQFQTSGRNSYFILEPGYKLVFEGIEDEDTVRLVISVTDKTIKIGDVETRIVEEKESVNSQIIEISRNFFAFCPATGGIFYFGEDVDIYKDGQIINHNGSWRAFQAENKPGLMIPGIALLGSRYYQEIAPGMAMDRAEIIANDIIMQTPAR